MQRQFRLAVLEPDSYGRRDHSVRAVEPRKDLIRERHASVCALILWRADVDHEQAVMTLLRGRSRGDGSPRHRRELSAKIRRAGRWRERDVRPRDSGQRRRGRIQMVLQRDADVVQLGHRVCIPSSLAASRMNCGALARACV